MERIISSMLMACFFIPVTPVLGQSGFRVTDPRLEFRDNKIHITYDILNYKPDDKFTVGIDVTDSDGNAIRARALTGEIGEEIEGGRNKQVTWNLAVDEIVMNAEIFFEVRARLIPRPEPELPSDAEAEGATPSGESTAGCRPCHRGQR